jgi:hypothetical protein
MNLIESKEESERAFYLRLLGNCVVAQATAQPPFSHDYQRPQAKEYPSGLQPLTGAIIMRVWIAVVL